MIKDTRFLALDKRAILEEYDDFEDFYYESDDLEIEQKTPKKKFFQLYAAS